MIENSLTSRWHCFWYAIHSRTSLLIANMTWGLVTGVAMVQFGLTDAWALFMSFTVYSGSTQLAGLQLMVESTSIIILFAVGVILNLRFVIYSATLYPYFSHLSSLKRFLLGYFTTDMAYFHFLSSHQTPNKELKVQQEWFYYGALFSNWITWQISTIVGIILAQFIDKSWSLDFAADLALIGVLLPAIKNKPLLIAAISAGLTAWLMQTFPYRLGLLCAIIIGMLAGIISTSYVKSLNHVE